MGNNLVYLILKLGLSDIIFIMNNQGVDEKVLGVYYKCFCFFYVIYLCGILCVFLDSKGIGKFYCSMSIFKCGWFYLDICI